MRVPEYCSLYFVQYLYFGKVYWKGVIDKSIKQTIFL